MTQHIPRQAGQPCFSKVSRMAGPLGGQQWPARELTVDTHPRRQESPVRAEGAIPEREVPDVAEVDRDTVRPS